MKIKIYAFCLLNLFNLLNVKAQENLRTFQNNEYVKINKKFLTKKNIKTFRNKCATFLKCGTTKKLFFISY